MIYDDTNFEKFNILNYNLIYNPLFDSVKQKNSIYLPFEDYISLKRSQLSNTSLPTNNNANLNNNNSNNNFNNLDLHNKLDSDSQVFNRTNYQNKTQYFLTEPTLSSRVCPTSNSNTRIFSTSIYPLSKSKGNLPKIKMAKYKHQKNKLTPFQVMERLSKMSFNCLSNRRRNTNVNSNCNFFLKNNTNSDSNKLWGHNNNFNLYNSSFDKGWTNFYENNDYYNFQTQVDKDLKIRLKRIGNYCSIFNNKKAINRVDVVRKKQGLSQCEVDNNRPKNFEKGYSSSSSRNKKTRNVVLGVLFSKEKKQDNNGEGLKKNFLLSNTNFYKRKIYDEKEFLKDMESKFKYYSSFNKKNKRTIKGSGGGFQNKSLEVDI